jgi:hypothetical protein
MLGETKPCVWGRKICKTKKVPFFIQGEAKI